MFALCQQYEGSAMADLFRLAGTVLSSLVPEDETYVKGRLDTFVNECLPFEREDGGTTAQILMLLNYLDPDKVFFIKKYTDVLDRKAGIVIFPGHAVALVKCTEYWQIRDPNQSNAYPVKFDDKLGLQINDALRNEYGEYREILWLYPKDHTSMNKFATAKLRQVTPVYSMFTLSCLSERMDNVAGHPELYEQLARDVEIFGGKFYWIYTLCVLTLYNIMLSPSALEHKTAKRYVGNLIKNILLGKVMRKQNSKQMDTLEYNRQYGEIMDPQNPTKVIAVDNSYMHALSTFQKQQATSELAFVDIQLIDILTDEPIGLLNFIMYIIQIRYTTMQQDDINLDLSQYFPHLSLKHFTNTTYYPYWEILQKNRKTLHVKEYHRMFCDACEGPFFDKMVLLQCEVINKYDVPQTASGYRSLYLRARKRDVTKIEVVDVIDENDDSIYYQYVYPIF